MRNLSAGPLFSLFCQTYEDRLRWRRKQSRPQSLEKDGVGMGQDRLHMLCNFPRERKSPVKNEAGLSAVERQEKQHSFAAHTV